MSQQTDTIINGDHNKPHVDLFSKEYASARDQEDPLRHFRDEFNIPTKHDLKRTTLITPEDEPSSEPCIYLCGNSLGVQPKRVRNYVEAQLTLWNHKGVYGHFKTVKESPVSKWLYCDEDTALQTAHIVGADPSEVAVMQTLTANLHFLMASFYKPTKDRYKIIIENKAFPSDHFAVESQVRHHGLTTQDAMVMIQPPAETAPLFPTEHILSVIDTHASSAALLLLPGIQFYTGQLFDIQKITAYAKSKGITVGWDLAHAVGNVPLHLHDWNVDFAAWCNYKYLNSGPGAIGALFVHSRHTPSGSDASASTNGGAEHRARLQGWWGSSRESRFNMTNEFEPIVGAKGFQISNPSALCLSSVAASLSVFGQTDMDTLRQKSLKLTGYLEKLLTTESPDGSENPSRPWKIITPSDPAQRGAQLSVLLEPGLLEPVMQELEDQGIVCDDRKPSVIRVSPTPMYNNFEDVRQFSIAFYAACKNALSVRN